MKILCSFLFVGLPHIFPTNTSFYVTLLNLSNVTTTSHNHKNPILLLNFYHFVIFFSVYSMIKLDGLEYTEGEYYHGNTLSLKYQNAMSPCRVCGSIGPRPRMQVVGRRGRTGNCNGYYKSYYITSLVILVRYIVLHNSHL